MSAKNNINLHILKASRKLTPYIKDIEKVFNNCLIKVNNKIIISNIDVVVCDDPYRTMPEIGVGDGLIRKITY